MSATFKTLDELDLKNKRVLLRADLNVPVADGKVTDATRIERLVPTIREIVKHDGKAILLTTNLIGHDGSDFAFDNGKSAQGGKFSNFVIHFDAGYVVIDDFCFVEE